MTEQGTLDRQITVGLQRLEALRDRSDSALCDADRPLVQQLVAELSTALAELAATAEELQQRNHDLVAAHQALVTAHLEANRATGRGTVLHVSLPAAG